MTKNYPGEQWKIIQFDFAYTNETSLEVSNFGRVRSFNKISSGNILNGDMINGYRILRLRFYRPRDKEIQKRFDHLKQQVARLSRKLKTLKENKESKKTINETAALLDSLKNNLSEKLKADSKERTINYHSLIHRLVADHFLKKPTAKQTIVSHLDHDKLNNRASNLRWMTIEENYEHQKSSPHVISDKKDRLERRSTNSNTKLTVTKVMLLKKLIKEDKPVKQLVKTFKVTETQILRIKRGENWGDIKAAK